MAKIKNLIFDMGNVLMRYDPEVPLREYVSSEQARNLIRKELFQGPEWVERDRGTISIEEMYESVAKRIPEQYHEAGISVWSRWRSLQSCVRMHEDGGIVPMCFPMPQMSFIGIFRNFLYWKILMESWYLQMYI